MSMTRGAKMLMIRNESRRGGSGGRNEGGSGGQNEIRNEMRYEGGSGGRNEMRNGEMRNEMRNGGDMRYEMRGAQNEMRNEMRGEGGSGGRNGYSEMNYPQNEYGGMNYGESRFRDRRGREHYDNGRFAPMRGEMEEMRGEMRNEMGYSEMRGEMRNPRNEMRGAYDEMRGEEMRGAEMRRGSGGRSHYPFGPVPPIYEGGGEMNRIGFVVPIGQSEVGGTFRNDASYSEISHHRSEMMRGGASGDTMVLTQEMAEEWMDNLQNEDGTKGPHWTMDQVKQVMNQRNIRKDPLEFWVVLNSMYADYCNVFKKHSVNKIDFYADMACAWLDDKDAQEGKTARYFRYITK